MGTLFNDNWEFVETPLDTPFIDVDEDDLKPVSLPHDFLITDASGLYRDATGWYRRILTEKEAERRDGERLILNFDGVYMDTRVYINAEEIAEWKYGYSSFNVDITDHLKEDGDNEILVSIRHQSPNTRWYSGAGIYRDVTLIKKSATSIPVNGVYIHAEEREAGRDTWELTIRTEIEGADAESAEVKHTLQAPDGTVIELTPLFKAELKTQAPYIQGRETDEKKGRGLIFKKTPEIRSNEQRFSVSGVERWDIEKPNLYTLKTELVLNGEVKDIEYNRVGFRAVTLDPQRGFIINGNNLKLNGVCEHHDLGAFGAAFNRTAFKRKLKKLRSMGVNALRLTHNMAAKQVLELADEMGFVLISEAFDMWERPKTDCDYARFFKKWHTRDVESWVRRDRNHPSVVMWSIGNEIYDTHADKHGQEITADLKALVEKFDPLKNGRATIGSNYMPWEGAQKCADILKIAGYNYAEKCYEEHHKEHPDWVIYGSETASIVSSRGVYHFPLAVGTLAEEDEQCSALGNSCTSWGAHSYEECAGLDRDMPFSMGQFLWTGFDYIGEPTPYHTKNSYFGQIDTAGFPKDAYYFWKSVWTSPEREPMVHIIPGYWDFNEGQLIDVRVVSNCDTVELYLNGKSLGEKTLTHRPESGLHLFADYQIAFERGELKAVARGGDRGSELAQDILKSFGDTASLKVVRETDTDESDVLFFDISALDKDNNPVGNASDLVKVKVRGNASLIGLDNGDSTDTTDYAVDTKRLFNGRLLAIVRVDENTADDYVGIDVSIEGDTVPARKLEIFTDGENTFTADKKELTARVRVLPENATDREVEFKAVNDTGVGSHLVKLSETKTNEDGTREVKMTAMGDGNFRLRAVSKSGTDKPRILSELEFKIEGVGTAYLDPYGFIAGSLYTRSIGEVGNGNEKGIASARDQETVIIWDNLDFGRDCAEKIIIPIFTLNDDAYSIKLWRGVPGEDGAELLSDGIYQKPSIWNTYQPEEYKLKKPLTGIQTISIVVDKKFHIKGFEFERTQRAFSALKVTEADAVYGDLFRKEEDAIYDIGNNVSIVFNDMDFGDGGARRIRIVGKGAQDNSVHVRFADKTGDEIKQLVEFKASESFAEQTFDLTAAPEGVVRGKKDVSLIFLPGTVIDLKEIRFE